MDWTEEIVSEFLHDWLGRDGFSKVVLARTREGESRGFAFVYFNDQTTIEKAVMQLNGLQVS